MGNNWSNKRVSFRISALSTSRLSHEHFINERQNGCHRQAIEMIKELVRSSICPSCQSGGTPTMCCKGAAGCARQLQRRSLILDCPKQEEEPQSHSFRCQCHTKVSSRRIPWLINKQETCRCSKRETYYEPWNGFWVLISWLNGWALFALMLFCEPFTGTWPGVKL